MNHHSRWRFTACSAECVEGARAYVGDGREVGVTALPSLISPPTPPSPPRSISDHMPEVLRGDDTEQAALRPVRIASSSAGDRRPQEVRYPHVTGAGRGAVRR